jgi:hypothetical protein
MARLSRWTAGAALAVGLAAAAAPALAWRGGWAGTPPAAPAGGGPAAPPGWGCAGCGAAAAAMAGVAFGVGAASGAGAVGSTPPPPPVGSTAPALPGGCIPSSVKGVSYYQCGTTWFRPYFGSSGVYYKVVVPPAP